MARALARFTIEKTLDEAFLIVIEDDSGTTIELEATGDQLDQIAETIDEQMSADFDDPDMIDDDGPIEE